MKTEEPADQDEAPQLPQLPQLDLQQLPPVPPHEIKSEESPRPTPEKQWKCALDTLFGDDLSPKLNNQLSNLTEFMLSSITIFRNQFYHKHQHICFGGKLIVRSTLCWQELPNAFCVSLPHLSLVREYSQR